MLFLSPSFLPVFKWPSLTEKLAFKFFLPLSLFLSPNVGDLNGDVFPDIVAGRTSFPGTPREGNNTHYWYTWESDHFEIRRVTEIDYANGVIGVIVSNFVCFFSVFFSFFFFLIDFSRIKVEMTILFIYRTQ